MNNLTRVTSLVLLTALAGCSAGEDTGSSSAAVKVCGTTTVKGIDVYHGDNGGNPIDWNAVKGAGIDFAFAKATESTNFSDPAFATNWAGMKSAGLVRGAYHFFHSDVDPTAQATFFLGKVGTVSKGDLLVLDLESANGQTQATISANAATFLAAVETATGVTPFLYTSPAFLSSFSAFSSYPLWVANYGVTCPDVPSAWTTYTFWQSTGSGSLSVITGALDLDTFNGTLAQLQALGGSTPPPDAGTTTDSGTPLPDAGGGDTGSTNTNDAATNYPDASGSEPNDWHQGSSGCSTGPTERASWSWAGVLIAIGMLLRRSMPRRRDRQ